MREVIIAVQGTLSDGSQQIELLVHSHNLGNPSPCHIYENGVYRGMVGGAIASLEQMLAFEAAKHPGFAIKGRGYYLASVNSRTEEEMRESGARGSDADDFR